MNTKLSCTHHVNATVQKIYCVLRKLWFAARFLQPDLKLKLIKSFIIPFITYGANVYGVPDSTSIKKLQLAINYCARFIYCKRKYVHISEKIFGICFYFIKLFITNHPIICTVF